MIVCFYSTYEELKQLWRQLGCIKPSCFYSTYEELKHFNKTICKTRKSGFYSTYEELKLFNGVDLIGWFWMFLQYLWGIETAKRTTFNNFCTLVFTVPMRNWNIFVELIKGGTTGFYSTYEELKQSKEVE